MNLRLATINEAEKVWEMQKIAFASLFEKYKDIHTNPANESLERVVNRFNQVGRFYYFIEDGNEIVGVICVIDRKGSNKMIAPMFILPQYEGRGFAQQAVVLAEAIHGEYGWELDTIEQEPRLNYLYEKLGYVRTGDYQKVNEKMTLVFYVKKEI